MQKLLALIFLSIFLIAPVHADDNSLWDDIKEEISDDDSPGQHGRDNAAQKQRENPGKGSKGGDDNSLWDKISNEVDGDEKNKNKNKNKK